MKIFFESRLEAGCRRGQGGRGEGAGGGGSERPFRRHNYCQGRGKLAPLSPPKEQTMSFTSNY